ncbi:hypothetical protein PHYPSEUDO_002918 [Phytophthora pseudosyringae]|uniref:Uncharacterized protein n=1 Tax=Phytophthora pseudosyringae TaxID=221518 RepID=A0A8T1VX49_9STRA|nr:hypothetical protein PHYPSEUDO_002918 [Phytophthora pseudosyringae]
MPQPSLLCPSQTRALRRRTLAQRAEDKCVYWAAQVDWWERWASDHGLSLDAASSAGIHLSFMQGLATQASQEQQATSPPPQAKETSDGE